MNNRIAIFFDIDGTILCHHPKMIPESTIKTLEELHELKNVDLFISTGRSKETIEEIKEIKYLFNGFNLSNGGEVIYQGKSLYQDFIHENDVKRLISKLLSDKASFCLVKTTGIISYFKDKLLKEEFQKTVVCKLNDYYEGIPLDDVIEMWILMSHEYIENLSKTFSAVDYFLWGKGGCDVVRKNRTKGDGIKKIIEICGYKRENTFAFGDADNDVPMFACVGTSFAMKECSQKAGAAATHVIDSIKNDGIYKAYLQYLKDNIE